MNNDVMLVPVTAVQPDLVTQTDTVVYVPLASKTAHGIVKIGEGLNVTPEGVLSFDRSEVTIKTIALNNVDIAPDENKRVNIVLHKRDVGLDNVDNTADADKPISRATQRELNRIQGLIKGSENAVAYDDYKALIDDFNSLESDIYNVGQSVYIRTLNVPDLWIYDIEEESEEFTYIDDSTIESILKIDGTFKVGYYRFAMLDTLKVDLTNYVTSEDLTLTLENYVTSEDLDTRLENVAYQDDLPQQYIKDATVSNNTLIITKQDDSVLEFEGGKTSIIIDSELSSESTNPAQNKVITQALEEKVDKVDGKGLSTNDFTDDYKSQVESNTTARHTHTNKKILDGTTASYTTDNALSVDFAESERQKSKNLLTLRDNTLEDAGVRITYNEKDQTITFNGTATSLSERHIGFIEELNLLQDKTYTLNATVVSGSGTMFLYLYNTATGLWTDVFGGALETSTTIKSDKNIKYNALRWYVESSWVFDNLVIKLQVEEGTTATDWQFPYGAIVHENNPALVFAKSERQKSKNLFDINKLSFGSFITNNGDGSLTVNGNYYDLSQQWFTEIVKLEAGKNYTLSAITTGNNGIAIYDGSTGNTIWWSFGETKIFTQEEINYMREFYMYGWQDTSISYTIKDIQVEEGSVATDYQPYGGRFIQEKELKTREVLYNDSESININDSTLTTLAEYLSLFDLDKTKTYKAVIGAASNANFKALVGNLSNNLSYTICYIKYIGELEGKGSIYELLAYEPLSVATVAKGYIYYGNPTFGVVWTGWTEF